MGNLQGWLGQVVFGNQAAFGTKVVGTKIQTCDYGITLKLNKPGREPMKAVRKGRYMSRAKKGLVNVDGSIPMILTPSEYGFGRFWANILASNAVSGDATDGYTHTFDETDTLATLSTYGETIERNVGSIDTAANSAFDTMFLAKATVVCPEEGAVMVNTDWIGRNETHGVTVQSVSYGTDNCFEGYMGDVLIGANLGAVASVPVKDWTLEITTNVKLIKQKGSQSQFATTVVFGVPEYKVTFNKLADDEFDTIYDYFKNETENAVQLHLKHGELSGSAPGSEFEWTFNLPRVVWQGNTPELSNEDDQNLSMSLTAMEEQSSYNYTAQLVIKNDEAGTYTAS
jgi:hypothetical protein